MHYLLINGSSLFWAGDAMSKRKISLGMNKRFQSIEVRRCMEHDLLGSDWISAGGLCDSLLGRKQLF